MAHPFSAHRAHHVERNRVAHIAGGEPPGLGGVPSSRPMPPSAGPTTPAPVGMKPGGMKRGGRLDKYARGGKVKKGTTVNVVIAGQGDKQPVPVPVPAPSALPGGAGPPPPRPPMQPPAGAAPPGGPPGMPPPGIRRHGGRAYARGGSVKSGPTWEEGKRNGTQRTRPARTTATRSIPARPCSRASAAGQSRGMTAGALAA